jgi:hypothetical protein
MRNFPAVKLVILTFIFMGAGVNFAEVPTNAPVVNSAALVTPTVTPTGKPAPRPLYRDPVYDAPTDPVLCFQAETGRWLMYYTARRGNLSPQEAPGVSWVHGTEIGVAQSTDGGATWKYLGTAGINYRRDNKDGFTYWAPEVIWNEGIYHMFLTYVPGVFNDWHHPRQIIHLTSHDGLKWETQGPIDLHSDRVIDPCVIHLPGSGWRMWYKDEQGGSRMLFYADSPDLKTWVPKGRAVTEFNGEGPKVIHWRDHYWLIADCWANGMRVWKSDDCTHWAPQPETLVGSHGDAVLSGNRVWWFYFTNRPNHERTTAIDVVELDVIDGRLLAADPAKPTLMDLQPVRESEQ